MEWEALGKDTVLILFFYYCSEYAFLFPFPPHCYIRQAFVDLPGSTALSLQAGSILLFAR